MRGVLAGVATDASDALPSASFGWRGLNIAVVVAQRNTAGAGPSFLLAPLPGTWEKYGILYVKNTLVLSLFLRLCVWIAFALSICPLCLLRTSQGEAGGFYSY